MQKKKFNVQGTVLANIVANGIEAENKEEAIEKFKNIFEQSDLVDWTDWYNDIEVREAVDYADMVNKILKKMGLDYKYKVLNIPEIVYDYGDFSLFSVNFKVLSDGRQIAISGEVFFIVFDTGELFLPINQSFFADGYYSISFNYMSESKNVPFKENLTKVFFTDGEDVLAYVPTASNGFFTMYEQKGVPTSLGKRVNYIIKKIGIEVMYVTNSSDYDLELKSLDKKIDFRASYKSENDYIPERLTKIESII
jgi:hypothetical protein